MVQRQASWREEFMMDLQSHGCVEKDEDSVKAGNMEFQGMQFWKLGRQTANTSLLGHANFNTGDLILNFY